jgi:hypothetical protein
VSSRHIWLLAPRARPSFLKTAAPAQVQKSGSSWRPAGLTFQEKSGYFVVKKVKSKFPVKNLPISDFFI